MAILIVDNETKTRDTLRHLLHRIGHKVVLEAKNSDEALKILRASKTRIKMVLADLDRSRSDTLGLAQKLSDCALLSMTPLLVISSESAQTSGIDLKNSLSQIDYFLRKPFQINGLSKSMSQAFQRRCAIRNTLVFIGERLPEGLHPALCKNTLWNRVSLIHPEEICQSTERVCAEVNDRLTAAIVIDTGSVDTQSAQALAQILKKFKKLPQTANTPIACLGMESHQVFPFRNYSRFFIEAQQASKQWKALLSQMQVRVTESWNHGLLLRSAKINLQNKAYSSALRQIASILKVDPSHCDAIVAKGSLLEAQGKIAEARSAYEKAIKLNPCLTRPYIKLLSLKDALDEEALRRIALQGLQYCPTNSDLLSLIAEHPITAQVQTDSIRPRQKTLHSTPC